MTRCSGRGVPLLPVLMALALTLSPTALTGQDAEAAIRELGTQYAAAFNAGDADAAASVYALDGTHTYAFGVTHRGRDGIARGLHELFAGPLKGGQVTLSTLEVRSLAPDIAVEESAFTVAGLRGPDGAPMPDIKGLCLGTYQRADEGWRIAAIQCMVPPPPPAGGAAPDAG